MPPSDFCGHRPCSWCTDTHAENIQIHKIKYLKVKRKENDSPFLSSYLLPITSLLWCGLRSPFPTPCWISFSILEILIGTIICRSSVYKYNCCEFIVQQPSHIQKTAFPSSPPHLSAPMFFQPPLFCSVLWAWWLNIAALCLFLLSHWAIYK